jgi:CrcB protein
MAAIDLAFLVGTGGAIGALARYFLGRAVDHEAFPVGTLTVNVVGSFVLGLVTFAAPAESVALFVGVGACGAFTTFSSFAVDTVRLWEDGRPAVAVGNAVVNLAGALAAVGLAWLLTTA